MFTCDHVNSIGDVDFFFFLNWVERVLEGLSSRWYQEATGQTLILLYEDLNPQLKSKILCIYYWQKKYRFKHIKALENSAHS